ncbi:MAG: ASKHA domain-containing protein, partial [Sedimentisphaerales bacterium]|nr:ASKHA domain-containing protein [Sedimentisphaerales bacterium]
PAFVVTWDGSGRPGVILTQSDIRQVQLAKGAIRAGIEVLLAKTGLKTSDLQTVLLAGAFGHYIDASSAIRIGLLPQLDPGRVRAVGNAALAGARMILLDGRYRAKASGLARSIRYIELASEPMFEQAFPDAMEC